MAAPPKPKTKRFGACSYRDGIRHRFIYETTPGLSLETLRQIAQDAGDTAHPLDWITAVKISNQIRRVVVKAWLPEKLRRSVE